MLSPDKKSKQPFSILPFTNFRREPNSTHTESVKEPIRGLFRPDCVIRIGRDGATGYAEDYHIAEESRGSVLFEAIATLI